MAPMKRVVCDEKTSFISSLLFLGLIVGVGVGEGVGEGVGGLASSVFQQ